MHSYATSKYLSSQRVYVAETDDNVLPEEVFKPESSKFTLRLSLFEPAIYQVWARNAPSSSAPILSNLMRSLSYLTRIMFSN
jgi:hypothetical protein